MLRIYFFSNIDITEFKTKAEQFSLNNIDILIRKNALERIERINYEFGVIKKKPWYFMYSCNTEDL